jgi:hypothetical protein
MELIAATFRCSVYLHCLVILCTHMLLAYDETEAYTQGVRSIIHHVKQDEQDTIPNNEYSVLIPFHQDHKREERKSFNHENIEL